MRSIDELNVRRDARGVYFARPYLGTDVNGKPIRPYKSFPEAKSLAEARLMAREWASGLTASAGMHVGNTIGEIMGRYLRALEARDKSPSTLRTYRSLVSCYAAPAFGRMAPQDLQPYMMEDFYTEMLLEGVCGRERLSPNTVRKFHGFMNGFYSWMRRNEVLQVNPMASVEPPPKEHVEAAFLDEAQMAEVDGALSRIVFDRDAAPFERAAALAGTISLWQGLRVGEDCALGRGDANLGRRNLHVHANAVEAAGGVERRMKTKGKKSRNSTITDRVAEAIEFQWAWQGDYYGKEASAPSFPICSGADGRLVRPSSVSRWFRREICQRLGLPRDIHFHSLRHTNASVLLAEGVDLKTAAERLGHAKETLTLEIYGHVMPGRDERAAEVLDKVSERMGASAA